MIHNKYKRTKINIRFKYKKTFLNVKKRGVKTLCYNCKLSLQEIKINKPVKIL